MVINPISVQGEITRAQDLTTIKHNQDNKGAVEQLGMLKQHENRVEDKAKQVQQQDNTANEGKRYDAKEKGNGRYAGDGGKGRKKEEEKKPADRVIVKGQSSFDIKI